MSQYFENQKLLSPPVKRAAFSDRVAYLMAEMSRLAYFRFEGGTNIDDILKLVHEIVIDKEKLVELEALIKNTVVTNSAEEAEKILHGILSTSGFELVRTFNNVETDAQAFLCLHKEQKIAILAFRGTEQKLKDIKTDVQASLVTADYGANKSVKIHSGYYTQFTSIEQDIRTALDDKELDEFQLFITGHSLGGALAITATKFLAGDSTGACYTFGSPPVGTKDFDEDIKTPIYRIVNYVDIVPRLPNPYMVGMLRGIGFILGLVLSPLGKVYDRMLETAWYKKLEKFLFDAGQYRQSGYGSYLTGNSSNVKLRYNVMFYDKVGWWLHVVKNKILHGEMEMLSDHSIALYSQKLEIWANKRLSKKGKGNLLEKNYA